MLLGCIWTLELRRYDSAQNNSVAMRFGDVASMLFASMSFNSSALPIFVVFGSTFPSTLTFLSLPSKEPPRGRERAGERGFHGKEPGKKGTDPHRVGVRSVRSPGNRSA